MPGPWEKYAQQAPATSGPWAKYAAPQGAAPAQKTLLEAAFPASHEPVSPTQVQTPLTFGFGASGNVGPLNIRGFQDAASLPTRAAGSIAGQLGYTGATGGPKSFLEGLADTETGLARPARQAMGGMVKEGFQGGPDGRSVGDYLKMGAGGLGYLAASMAEDPAVLLGGAAKVAPKALGGLASKAVRPVATAAKAARNGAADVLEAGANKVQNTIIRPRQIDEAAGFNIQHVNKHGVSGSLEEVIGKSQAKIEDAAKNLKALIKQGKDNGARVNLNDAVKEVEQEIFKGKAKEFANLKESPAALKDLRERIALLADDAPGGNVDLVDAQYVKQALGDMGAFEHIAGKQGVTISKEDRALSQIASRVYLKLKDKIEAAAPAGVKEQNQILSELMPVNRAALYRKLVADRNNVVSMSDMLGAMATIGGGPKGLALWAASRATKSGNTAKVLYSAAKALRASKTPQEATFYAEKLKKLGIAAAEIEAIQGATQAAQSANTIPFRKVAEEDSMNQPQARK